MPVVKLSDVVGNGGASDLADAHAQERQCDEPLRDERQELHRVEKNAVSERVSLWDSEQSERHDRRDLEDTEHPGRRR